MGVCFNIEQGKFVRTSVGKKKGQHDLQCQHCKDCMWCHGSVHYNNNKTTFQLFAHLNSSPKSWSCALPCCLLIAFFTLWHGTVVHYRQWKCLSLILLMSFGASVSDSFWTVFVPFVLFLWTFPLSFLGQQILHLHFCLVKVFLQRIFSDLTSCICY